MKTLVILISSLISCCYAYSQSLDNEIKSIAHEVAVRVIKKNRIRLAVADFINNSGKIDPLTKYVTEQVEAELLKPEYELELIDRKHIEQLLSDNRLQSEGLIDESTAKSSVAFIKVDGWVFGEITSFDEEIKITLKIIDVSTSLIYASASSGLISDPAINKLKESSNQQKGILKECQKNNTGDFCFVNTSDREIIVEVSEYYTRIAFVTLEARQSQCLYNLQGGTYTYKFWKQSDVLDRQYRSVNDYQRYGVPPNGQGQIMVEKCKSKSLTLK